MQRKKKRGKKEVRDKRYTTSSLSRESLKERNIERLSVAKKQIKQTKKTKKKEKENKSPTEYIEPIKKQEERWRVVQRLENTRCIFRKD